MELEPVTKLDKRIKITSKSIDDDVISGNCVVIAIFPIYGQFVAISKLDSGRIVCKIYILIFSLIVTFYLTKLKTELKKSLTQLSHYCFE